MKLKDYSWFETPVNSALRHINVTLVNCSSDIFKEFMNWKIVKLVLTAKNNFLDSKFTSNLVQWKYFGQKDTKFSANIVKEITYINRIITVMWKRSIVILWCKAKFSLKKIISNGILDKSALDITPMDKLIKIRKS